MTSGDGRKFDISSVEHDSILQSCYNQSYKGKIRGYEAVTQRFSCMLKYPMYNNVKSTDEIRVDTGEATNVEKNTHTRHRMLVVHVDHFICPSDGSVKLPLKPAADVLTLPAVEP